jgi:hypothetical protein
VELKRVELPGDLVDEYASRFILCAAVAWDGVAAPSCAARSCRRCRSTSSVCSTNCSTLRRVPEESLPALAS